MKVLFLDMDGVVNSQESFERNHERSAAAKLAPDFDPIAHAREFFHPLGHIESDMVARLNRIVRETTCKIVISSAWRVLYDVEQIRNFLVARGFEFPAEIISMTGHNSEIGRGGEINEWLEANPEALAYAIVDDDSMDIVGKYTAFQHQLHFVQTNFMHGLQDAQADKIIGILNGNKGTKAQPLVLYRNERG